MNSHRYYETHISHQDAALASPKDPTRPHLCLPGPIQLTSSKPNSQNAPLHFKTLSNFTTKSKNWFLFTFDIITKRT